MTDDTKTADVGADVAGFEGATVDPSPKTLANGKTRYSPTAHVRELQGAFDVYKAQTEESLTELAKSIDRVSLAVRNLAEAGNKRLADIAAVRKENADAAAKAQAGIAALTEQIDAGMESRIEKAFHQARKLTTRQSVESELLRLGLDRSLDADDRVYALGTLLEHMGDGASEGE